MGVGVGIIAACEVPVVGCDNGVGFPLLYILSAREERIHKDDN